MKARREVKTHRCGYCETTYDGPAEEVEVWLDSDGDFWNVVGEDYPDAEAANESCPWPEVSQATYYRCGGPHGGHLGSPEAVQNNGRQVCGECGTEFLDNPHGATLAEECCL